MAVVAESESFQVRHTVSNAVKALLCRHGIADARQQITTLMGIMDASHSQVYRKVSGRSSWLEEDLQRIVDHFGETFASLFAEAAPDASQTMDSSVPWQLARIVVSGVPFDCEVQLSGNPPSPEALVLVQREGQDWVEVLQQPAQQAVVGLVAGLRLAPAPPQEGGYAVFDDDPDIADNIVDHLALKGLSAQAFYTQGDLKRSNRRFDTYILDWYASDGSTALEIVKHIKSSHAPDATVVILTGQIQRGHAEADLASLIHTHAVLVELKPIRFDLLFAKIEASKLMRGAKKVASGE